MGLVKILSVLSAACFILTGCATSRGTLDLTAALSDKVQSADSVKSVFIDKYTDNRVFATNASSPDKPTYDPSKGLDDETRAKIIARKRNGYGMAMGDIVLANGLTTEKLIRNIVSQAFVDAGYTVVTDDPDNKAVHANINVDRFWGWVEIGFFAPSVFASSELLLDLSYGDRSDSIHSYKVEENVCLIANGEEWKRAFLDNLKNVKSDLTERIKKSSISD
ncbi:MAG: hypothetical protein ACI4UM_05360 [Succinivibrio sp.]